MSKASPEEVLGIESLYDSALDGTFYEAILDSVFRAIPQAAVLLVGQDTVRMSGNFMLHRGLNADAIRSYAAALAVHNAWFEAQWRQMPGQVFRDEDLLSRESFVATRFYKDWLSLQGPLECATGLVISRNGTRQQVLEVRYPPHQADRVEPHVAQTLQLLAPHILRAVRVHQLRHRHPLDNEFTAILLELLSFPVFLLDDECRVRNMNSRADMLARRMDGLFVGANGHLYAMDPDCELRLQAAAEKLARAPQHSFELMSLRKADRKSRYFLSFTALGPGAGFGPQGREMADGQGNLLALIVQDSAEALRLTHDALWRVFGLTSAESELAMSLLEGRTIGEYAAMRAVSKQTLRNQLVSIMRKTDTSKQHQLVALLTRLAISSAH